MQSYSRFIAMTAASTLIMYGLMYLNTFASDHVFFSQTRAWMALYMGGAMAVVMMLFMWRMYDGQALKGAVMAAAVSVFGLGVYMVRSQDAVGDVAWMKAMIPHHSIALLTSTRADLDDPRVQDLARRIVDAQEAEIAEMKALIADLEG